MADEDQKILEQIAKLAGAINRHKNSTQEALSGSAYRPQSAPPLHPPGHHKTYTRSQQTTPYTRPAPPRGSAPASRHRTLVVNQPKAKDEESTGAAAGGKWIQKKDRHMQLINADVYDKKVTARTKAIEETRVNKEKRKAEKREKRERAQLEKFFGGNAETAEKREVMVNGFKYRLLLDGSKLLKSADVPPGVALPKKTIVGGVTFIRSKSGNYWRYGVVKAKRSLKKVDKLCTFFTRTGKCRRGLSCPYIHDPEKVAICPLFMKDSCPNGDACDLSHRPTPNRVPTCQYFLRGYCQNGDNCKYAHVRVSPTAPVCPDFAVLGYCEKGADCKEKHVKECPEFAEKGTCSNVKCKLPHIDHAGRKKKREEAREKRAAAAAAAADANVVMDMDSGSDSDEEETDDEEEGDDDEDFDSDDAEDWEMHEENETQFKSNEDFIRF